MQTKRDGDSERVARRFPTTESPAHRVTEVERPGALDDDGVLEHDVAADELTERADAGTEQHGHLADAQLVDEAEVLRQRTSRAERCCRRRDARLGSVARVRDCRGSRATTAPTGRRAAVPTTP